MSLEEQKLLYGHIIRILTYLDEGGEDDRPQPHYIVGKRFDKRYIYLVQNAQIRKLSNSDNSLFEIQHAERSFNQNISHTEVDAVMSSVKFGDEVVFKHVNSGNYLAIADDYSDGNRGFFKLLLAGSTANIRFQLKPSRSFEKTADPVTFDCNIFIYNPKYDAYLDSEISETACFLTGSHQKEVKWRMNFYSQNINCQDETIMDKDLVYLINSKGSGLLSLLVSQGYQKQPTLTRAHSHMSQGHQSHGHEKPSRCIEYVVRNVPESYPINKEPKLFNCIWLVTFDSNAGWDKQNDGIFPLRLTHLVEGQGYENTFGKLVHGFNNEQSRMGIRSGEYIKLGLKRTVADKNRDGSGGTTEVLSWLGEQENRMNESIRKRSIMKGTYCRAPRPANVKGLVDIPNESDSVVFQIIKLPFKIKKELYEFIEAREKMNLFNSWIGCEEDQAIRLQSEVERTRRFKETQQIFSYIKKALDNDPSQRLQKQMMLFDIRFLSTLIDALKILYKRQSDNPSDCIAELQKNKNDISKIFSQLHNILRLSCRDNPYIKQDISKSSVKDMLFLSTKASSSGSSFNQDTETLKQIFSGNKYAVENVMKPHEVEDLIDKFLTSEVTSQRFIRFVQIIRLLCRSANQVIPVNQRIIIKRFLQAGGQGHCNIHLQVNKRNEAQVNMGGEDWFSLIELCDDKRSSSSKEEWQEFIEWIQLVSDVCCGRNLTGKYYAQSLFNPKVLQYFIDFSHQTRLLLQWFDTENCRKTITRLKLHLLTYMLPLIINIHVAITEHPKIRFDQLYLFDSDDKIKHEEIYYRKHSTQTDMLQSIRNFVEHYLRLICQFQIKIAVTRQSNQQTLLGTEVEETDAAANFYKCLTHVMDLLEQMILNGLWSGQQDILKRNTEQSALVSTLTRILNFAEGNEGVAYQMSILRIINFYLDQAVQQKVATVIKGLNNRYKEEKKEGFCSNISKDNHQISASIDFMREDTLVHLRRSIFELMCSVAGHDSRLFILCVNTNKKLMEVRRTLYLRLKNTLVVEPTQQDMEIYRRIMLAREAFGVFKTKGLKTITIENQYELDMPIWDPNNDSIIGLILQLMNYMKLPYQPPDKPEIYEKLGQQDTLFQPYTEYQQPNHRVQKMLKQFNIHKLMFFIVCDFNIRTDLDYQLYAKLLECIYYFLAVFAWQNLENKHELSPIWEQMKEHAEANCGAITTLKEYFSENENLLYDENKILAVSEKITDYISVRCSQSAILLDHFYAAKLLDFFGALLSVKGVKLQQNCIRVLSFILDKARLHITKPRFLTDKETYKQLMDKHQQDRTDLFQFERKLSRNKPAATTSLGAIIENEPTQNNFEQQQRKRVSFERRDSQRRSKPRGLDMTLSFEGRLSYLIVLFRILAEVVEDNDINIAKCKKLHSPELLRTVLANSKRCWALKSTVRSYINRLYYSRMQTEYYDGISQTELELFIDDMNDYIYTRLNYRGLYQLRIQNPIKWSCPVTNLFLCIKNVVESLYIITDSKKEENFLNRLCGEMRRGNVERDDIDNVYILIKRFLRLYERLRFIKLYFFADELQLRGRIQTVLQRMEQKIFQFDFSRHTFINKNDKSFDYRQISKRLQVDDSAQSTKQQKNQLNEQLSLCSKMLSNTELQNYFTNQEYYETYAVNSDVVLSFLDKNENNPYLMIIDKKYKRKESVVRIMQAIINRKKVKDIQEPAFSDYYQQFLYGLFRGGKLKDLEPAILGVEKDRVKIILDTINHRISTQFHIFSSQHLTFYFRTLACNFIQLHASERNFLDFIYAELNVSFSELIFKTVVQCNLHQQIEVAYQLFYFAVTYYRHSRGGRVQQNLYQLIHADLKNEFLVKLDNFILALSNDIIRNCQAQGKRQLALKKSAQQSPQKLHAQSLYHPKIFSSEHMFFVDAPSEQYDVQAAIANQHILYCFKSVFQLLHLLCQNNFVQFKKEFREQKSQVLKLNNRNLLIRSTIELRKIFKVYSERIRSLPHKILDFLNQIAQIPCETNQIELSKSTFFEDVCQFVREFNYQRVKDRPELCKEVSAITEKFLKIVLSLLESNHNDIYTSFTNKMDTNFFSQLLRYHEQLAQDEIAAKEEKLGRGEELEENEFTVYQEKLVKLKFSILLIEKQLSSKTTDKDKLLIEVSQLIANRKNDPTFLQKENIESIEVTLQGNNHKLYFFKPEEAVEIDSQENECLAAISEGLKRETQLQKLDSLIRSLKDLELYMVYRSSLKNSRLWRFLLAVPFNTCATVVSLLINIILMVTTHLSIGVDLTVSQYAPLLFLLQIAQFMLSTVYCIATLYGSTRQAMLVKHNEDLQARDPDNYKVMLDFQPLPLPQLAWLLLVKNASVVTYELISILGLLVSPYYYCIHLFYLFGRVKTLTNVYQAIVVNLNQMLFLVFLSVAFFLVFSMLTLETYAPFANPENCESIVQCFLVVYNKEVYIQKNQANQPNFRTLSYEIIYAVFFGSLFGNVVSGLMTDTFAELRDEAQRMEQDEQNFCYICGQSRYEIEKQNLDGEKLNEIFQKHLCKHNKWSYLYYIYELKKKDSTEYTGLEYIIDEKVKKKSATWFPVRTYEQRSIQTYIHVLKQID